MKTHALRITLSGLADLKDLEPDDLLSNNAPESRKELGEEQSAQTENSPEYPYH